MAGGAAAVERTSRRQIGNGRGGPSPVARDAQGSSAVTKPTPRAVRVVLVVEDDAPVRELLAGAINDESGYLALSVASGQ